MNTTHAEEPQAIGSFTDKWRARWPEWSVAEVFVPKQQRDTVLAWMALLQELTDAAWGGSDPRPGEAKLGWWVEELQGWQRGMRRHPLGQALQKFPAPWLQLAAALPQLRNSRERAVDSDEAYAQLQAFASAANAIEQVLFGGSAEATETVATSLLHMRLAHHPSDAAPLQALAQAGEKAAIAEWTRQLAGRRPSRAASIPRRVLAGLARARLGRGKAVQPLSAMHALWVAWRSARS
jgi:phytoene/squalene synthetase